MDIPVGISCSEPVSVSEETGFDSIRNARQNEPVFSENILFSTDTEPEVAKLSSEPGFEDRLYSI